MFSSSGSNHPIIPKQTNLYLTPNYVTFHSEDRDETKFSSASQWATRLPQNINNIRSMHLVDWYLPTHHMFVFKNDYQNLAFMVRVKKSGADDCLIEQNNLYDNCSKESKCTPRLNLSRPLVPHSNVKFNESTKQYYAGINNTGPYQIPTIQLQNSFSNPPPKDAPNCTSYQNNLDGLNNMINFTCKNKVLCSDNVNESNGGVINCECVDITPTTNYDNETFFIRYINCCDKLVTMKYKKGDTIKCIKTEYSSGLPYWDVGSEGHVAKFTVFVDNSFEWNYIINITNCGEDNQVIETNNSTDQDGLPGTADWPLNVVGTTYTVNPSATKCCNELDNSCAPRSMCEQETALLRVNGTIPPYIRQMRENEDRVQKGEQPMEFNYDGCNAYCNEYDYQGTGCAYYMIRIKEGSYTGDELAQQLQDELKNTLSLPNNVEWKVHFSPINCRLYFYLVNKTAASLPDIEFRFDWKINYHCQNFSNKNQPEVWNNKHWWGLGYYLGFDKNNYNFKNTSIGEIMTSQITISKPPPPPAVQTPTTNFPTTSSYNDNYFLKPPTVFVDFFDNANVDDDVNGLVSCRSVNIEGPSVLYMEVEKYNNCDEITPGPSNTSSTYNNTFSGKPKTIFAKLEVTKTDGSRLKNDIHYITHMKNFLEERINKLEFKFRFHDGRYVYFGNNKDLNFTIQFNCAEPNAFDKVSFSAIPGWTVGT